LQLEEEATPVSATVPTRKDCLRIAQDRNPELRAAQQEVLKARAGLAAAKDNYIPDITGLACYSYQSGVPLLTHNFGTFGVTMSFVLFDGGRRNAEVKESRTLRSHAEINLAKVQEKVAVQVETAYDRVEQLQARSE
jgi:outer membrane protein TolC